ncbi:MAG: hypothetical protein KDJ51_15990, partial [Nitratireductor sp.]|nr:hypothetical protein [Nitratireductor sp.]
MPDAQSLPTAPLANLHSGWKTVVAIICFAAIGVLPALAIAHPALVVPLAAAPLGLIIMMRIPVWLVLGFVAFTFFR